MYWIMAERPSNFHSGVFFQSVVLKLNNYHSMSELLLRVRDMDELVKEVPNIVGIVESLTPFTQRHYDRLQLLTQQTTFLDYLWNSMKLEALEEKDDDGEGKTTNESIDDAEEDDKMEEDDVRDSDSGVMDEEGSEGES